MNLTISLVLAAIGLLVIGVLSALIVRAILPSAAFLPSLTALPIRRIYRQKTAVRESIAELIESSQIEAAALKLKEAPFTKSVNRDPSLLKLIATHNQRLLELAARCARIQNQALARLPKIEELFDELHEIMANEVRLTLLKKKRHSGEQKERKKWAADQIEQDLRETREQLLSTEKLLNREWLSLCQELLSPPAAEVVLH
jgi:hypothetical protein